MAPPKKELNEWIIYDLAKIHCTMNEIASVCDCSVDTLERGGDKIQPIIQVSPMGAEELRKLAADGK